jgi:hypothetical protein
VWITLALTKLTQYDWCSLFFRRIWRYGFHETHSVWLERQDFSISCYPVWPLIPEFSDSWSSFAYPVCSDCYLLRWDFVEGVQSGFFVHHTSFSAKLYWK